MKQLMTTFSRQPQKAHAVECITTLFPTPLGWIALVVTDHGLRHVSFGHRTAVAALEHASRHVGQTLQMTPPERCDADLRALVAKFESFAAGDGDCLGAVEVDDRAWTEFQRQVRAACRSIPAGETRTYGQLAAMAGSPGAARAVGRVMATNPLPLVIPCHRVVGSGGKLTGFTAPGGLATKRRMLEIERKFGTRSTMADTF